MKKDNKILKKERDKRIANFVLAVLMVIWSIGSIFGFIGFARSCEEDPVLTASAYTSYELMNEYPYAVCLESQTTFLCTGDFDSFLRLYYSNIPFELRLSVNDSFSQSYAVLLTDNTENYSENEDSLYIYLESDTISVRDSYYFFCYKESFLDTEVTVELFPMVGTIDCVFSCTTYLTAYDFVDSYVQSAHTAGYNEGYSVGEREGFLTGKNLGFDEGYSKGVLDSNDYSWNGLIASVIDVPVQAFTSLFNFEILGVNMASFFFALLSVCVVLVVIKLIM